MVFHSVTGRFDDDGVGVVEKAVENAKRTLIQDHLDHCLDETVGALDREQRKSIDAFKAITKYL